MKVSSCPVERSLTGFLSARPRAGALHTHIPGGSIITTGRYVQAFIIMGCTVESIRQRLQRLERHPSIVALGFLGAGILSTKYFGASGSMWPQAGLVCALGLGLVSLRIGTRRAFWPALLLLFLFLGAHTASKHLSLGTDFKPRPGRSLIQATVEGKARSGPDFRVFLVGSGTYVNGKTRLPGKGTLFLRDCDLQLGSGDRIAFRTWVRKPRNRGNPGELDWETHCLNRGIIWQASVRGKDSVLLIRRGPRFSPSAILFRLRERMAGFLDRHADAGVRGVLKGIVLGDRGELDPDLRKSFVDSGLVHLLSASGLHVAVVVLFTLVLVRAVTWTKPSVFLHLPLRKIAALASLVTMVVYCLLVGSRVPTVRATIMGMVFVSAVILDRRSLSANSLALAGIIILLYEPLSLFTPGFQLSFCAVAGILAVVPVVMEKWWEKKKLDLTVESDRLTHPLTTRLIGFGAHVQAYITALFCTSVAAQIAVAPVLLMTFHSLPVYSLFANLVAVPIFTFALPLALSATIIGSVVPQIGAWMLVPAEHSVRAIIWVGGFFSALPYGVLRISSMGFSVFLLVSLLATAMLWFFRSPSRRRFAVASTCAAALTIALGLSWLLGFQAPVLKVVYLNVGRGDSAIVSSPGGGCVLIDAGLRTAYFDAGRSIVSPFLQFSGIHSLAGAVISHPQMDHMGGLPAVMDGATPTRIWWNPIETRSEFFELILAKAESERIPVLRADYSSRPIRLGKAYLSFINPSASGTGNRETSQQVNDSSVVCRLEFGSVSFLFCGDVGLEAEKELLASGRNLRADILKVGHHGSRTSTSQAFIDAVRPRLAVVSCSYPAHGSFPSPVVMRRLRSSGARVLWTGRDGAVTVETDGKTITYETGRGVSGSIYPSREK
jgi:competence protein ComEC